jgi:drug/metabolite transporter (DMT)-like permease
MKILSKEGKGGFYAITSGLLYGLLGYFGKNIMEFDFSISNMLFWRFLIATIFLVAISIFVLRNIKLEKDLIRVSIINSIFYSGSAGTYFLAVQYISTGLAMVICFTYPVAVVLLDWYFGKQKITKICYISIFIIIIGMAILNDDQKLNFNFFGIFWATVSALSYAFYIFINRKQKNDLPPLVSSLLVTSGSCLLFFIISLFNQTVALPVEQNIWFVIGIGLVSTALPILFLLEALKFISPTKASILSVLEPVGVVIFGVILLDEKLTLCQLVGAVIILGGALLIQFDKKNKKVI